MKIAHSEVGYFFSSGGEDGNRTRLNGFAGRCITSLLPRLRNCCDMPSGTSETGAGEESRTLDLNLGKVALYQLSYSRMELYYSRCAIEGGG